MKIEKVILQNIGVYVNRNTFDLQAEQPIVLIGGMNGRGKTTFLDAILFALYGQRAIIDSKNLESYLRKISNVTGNDTQCFIEMQFTTQEQDKLSSYCIRREWDLRKTSLKMQTCVWREGTEDKTLSENWDLFVEEILPRAIASFFFFDGEKISELAASESDAYIRSSIVSLLGIDVIEQLLEDLKVISNSMQRSVSKGHYKEELESLEAQLRELEEQIQEKQKRAEDEQKEIRLLEDKISAWEITYTMTGGEYAQYQKKLKQEQKDLLRQIEVKQSKMLELAASELPLKLVESLLGNVKEAAKEEREQRELEVFARQFPVLYHDFSQEDVWDEQIKAFYESVKKQMADRKPVYHLDEDAVTQMIEIGRGLEEKLPEVRSLLRENEILENKKREIENYLAVKVEDDTLVEVYENIKKASAEHGARLSRMETVKKEQQEFVQREEGLKKMKKQILSLVVHEMETADEHIRSLSYIEKQERILIRYRERLQAMKSKELSDQMTACFQKLIAKDGLVKRIEIDPETLEFHYYGRDGKETDRQKFSSGEKQLLVIAMLWALSICSRSEFPLIIDTPLARLDSIHRKSLIENYFPKASEQVIILSTDQEITTQDYRMLKKYVGKEYTLVYDEQTMSSSIREGYFGGIEL